MKKIIKKEGKAKNTLFIIYFLIIFLVIIFFASGIKQSLSKNNNKIKSANEYTPTSDFYVNDFANILNMDTKSKIMDIATQIESKTTAQVVVVTVESIGDSSIDEFANDLFNSWKIGQSGKNNGVLLIISKNERKIKIEVGYGLEGAINDAKAGRILDNYAIPYLKNNDYDTGVLKTLGALESVIYQEYGVSDVKTSDEYNDVSDDYDNNQDEVSQNNQKNENIINAIIIFAFFFSPFIINIIAYVYNKKHHKNWPGNNNFFGGGFSGGSGFGRRRFIWRRLFKWRIFWWRRLFWWRRSI